MAHKSWTHLVRFIAKETGQIHLGQVDAQKFPDVGLSTFRGEDIDVNVISGSVFHGIVTEQIFHIQQLLPPLAMEQVPLIKCLGLNYKDHAREANMPIPDTPVLFIKPRMSLNRPYPAKINIPKIAQDDTADYEAELTFVVSKDGRDIPESEALDYVLGYTCGNDVSARTQQLKNSQWSYGKGMDGAAPIGPVLVSPTVLSDPHSLGVKAIHNGSVVQDTNTREMIFGIQRTISFLSTGTTLEKGTIVMTGTGPGIGMLRTPKVVLRPGDDMRVWIDKIGTLINVVYHE